MLLVFINKNINKGGRKIDKDIVACQRGGVSNKPLGQRQDTGPGILWSVHRWTRYYLDKNLKKEMNRIHDSPFLLRQGEPGTSQYIILN